MTSLCTTRNPETASRPTLRLENLRLSSDDRAGLESQGFVAPERLPSGAVCYKLRFREAVTGRQRVRYIGTDAKVAADVAKELEELQRDRKYLRQLTRQARDLLRTVRATLEPQMRVIGLRYPGSVQRCASRTARNTNSRDIVSSHNSCFNIEEEQSDEYHNFRNTTDDSKEERADGCRGRSKTQDPRACSRELETR